MPPFLLVPLFLFCLFADSPDFGPLPEKLKGTLVQIQLCIAKEKILTAAHQRGYRFKQKLTLPNGRSRIHLDAKITERFMT